ncbi:MAG: hypothetical protein AAGF66_13970 [Cyanobacteria bacterium P01_H01_bin.119]
MPNALRQCLVFGLFIAAVVVNALIMGSLVALPRAILGFRGLLFTLSGLVTTVSIWFDMSWSRLLG